MELNEKLQELRKQRGLTQEELASALYVSRTAISKWESGRGYPSIDSLRAIARFYAVTVDELLSPGEVLTIAEEDRKQSASRFRNLLFGLLDVCMALLLFLPFFAMREGGMIKEVSLLALDGMHFALKFSYFVVVAGLPALGILTLALQNCGATLWQKSKAILSLGMGGAAVLLFMMSLQPYAATFAFVLLAIKGIILIKKQ